MSIKDIMRHEFIGKRIKVGSRKVEGKVIDETKNSFLVQTEKGRKRLLKNNLKFEIKMDGKNLEIDGNKILMRPEDRIKIR